MVSRPSYAPPPAGQVPPTQPQGCTSYCGASGRGEVEALCLQQGVVLTGPVGGQGGNQGLPPRIHVPTSTKGRGIATLTPTTWSFDRSQKG